MDIQLERLRIFLAQGQHGETRGHERTEPGGLRVEVEAHGEQLVVVFGPRGRIGVEGGAGLGRSVLRAWAGLQPPPSEDRSGFDFGYANYYLGWREWWEEAGYIKKHIATHGYPDEANVPPNFRLWREVMFHDFMFKARSGATISAEKLAWGIWSWMSRYCFVPLDLHALVDDILDYVRDGFSMHLDGEGAAQRIPISLVAEAMSYVYCKHCSKRFVKLDGSYVCPQVRASQDVCTYNALDALYPYSDAGDVVAYTKGNLLKLSKRKTDAIKWYKLAPQSPIETLMASALEDAGVTVIPQFQARSAEHRYRIDFVIPTTGGPYLAVECDGLEFHANKQAYTRDQQRNRHLQEHGFYVMRFSSREIFGDVAACVEEIDRSFWRIQKGKLSCSDSPRTNYFGVGG